MPEPSIVLPLILFVVLALLVLSFVFAPLRAPARAAARRAAELERCRAEKDDVVRMIRELEFDLQTGKLSEADYRVARELAEQRGIELLQRLDTLAQPPSEDELEAEIEQARRSILRETKRA